MTIHPTRDTVDEAGGMFRSPRRPPMSTPPEHPAPESSLTIRDLGRISYAEALAHQRLLQQQVIEQRDLPPDAPRTMHLLLLEHDPPVITVSRRPGAKDHLLATSGMLQAQGVELTETDRGGDITYHGPGQLVAYAICDLNRLGLRIAGYMRFLEQIVIDTLAEFGVAGRRDESATGVWVASSATDDPDYAAKICAMGVRVTRWVSMHGLALNVAPDLSHFDLIVPCGLTGRTVTSMAALMKENRPTLDEVRRVLADQFTNAVEARLAATEAAAE
jgi:lipoyl(octanoyl) transferase